MFHVPCSMFCGSRRGQLLIEAIVAGAILIIGFTGSLALLARAFQYNRIITDGYIGTYLASEGIEIVKNVIDHNMMVVLGCGVCTPQIPPCPPPGCSWLAGFTNNTDYEVAYNNPGLIGFTNSFLKYDPATGMYGYAAGSATNYKRTIHVNFGVPLLVNSLGDPVEVEVRSTVTWNTGLVTQSASLVDKFYEWRY